MTENSNETGPAHAGTPQTKALDPAFLERVFQRTTREGAGALTGGPIIPRRRVTFVVSAADCAPGVFVDEAGALQDFTVTLEAPTAAQEIKITEGVRDPAEVGMRLAEASLVELNGAPVLGPQREFLWEALGPGGRQLVMMMYQEVGSASPEGLGKARSSASRG